MQFFLPHSVFVFSKQSEFVQPLPCIEPVLSLPSVAVVMMSFQLAFTCVICSSPIQAETVWRHKEVMTPGTG